MECPSNDLANNCFGSNYIFWIIFFNTRTIGNIHRLHMDAIRLDWMDLFDRCDYRRNYTWTVVMEGLTFSFFLI